MKKTIKKNTETKKEMNKREELQCIPEILDNI